MFVKYHPVQPSQSENMNKGAFLCKKLYLDIGRCADVSINITLTYQFSF